MTIGHSPGRLVKNSVDNCVAAYVTTVKTTCISAMATVLSCLANCVTAAEAYAYMHSTLTCPQLEHMFISMLVSSLRKMLMKGVTPMLPPCKPGMHGP